MTCLSTIKQDCIYKGQSYPLAYYVGSQDDPDDLTNWTCFLQVRIKSTRALTTISRAVTTKNTEGNKFITSLTTSETGLLQKGTYIVGAQLTNTVTGESGEILLELSVEDDWVTVP